MAASSAHDLALLDSLTHPDIVWELGPFTFRGKAEALRPHGTDLGLSGTLNVRNVEVRGDTVDATIVERNDATRAYGPDSLVHSVRYVFREGLMWRKSTRGPSVGMVEFQRRGEVFRQWVRDTRPDQARVLDGGGGVDQFGEERGRLLSILLAEWVSEGRPGA